MQNAFLVLSSSSIIKMFMRIKPAIILLLLTFNFSLLHSQTPATYSSADIYMQLKKLNVLGSVLYIAAHPDDENTRLLAYLSKEKQYRTGYMSLTRGDGGQNLIGDEQGIELGLIRTQELLSARRIDGAEQFFSRAYDFGFSKTAAEALKIWGHDKILSDVVWMIRKFQPDVIITRFPGDARAGHGHHWASNLLANEAFKIAGDSTKFPEQFQYGVKPWQAKRILWNTFNFGGTNTTSNDQFKFDVGTFNPLLGKGYGEIASESRSQHKSQGFGIPRQRGQAYEYFTTTGGDAPKDNLMDGITTNWDRVDGGAAIEQEVNDIIAHFNFEHPENSVDALTQLYQAIDKLADSYWKNKKLDEVKQLIVECSGLFAEATTNTEYVVTGDSIRINFFINKGNNTNIKLESVQLDGIDSTLNVSLPYDQNISFNKIFAIPVNAPITQPYWLEKPLDNGGSFDVDDQRLIGTPQNPAAYSAIFNLNINGVKLSVSKPVQYKYTDPVKGELYQPIAIIPPVIVSVSPNVVLTNIKPGNEHSANPFATVKYKTNFTAKQAPVTIKIMQGTSAVYSKDTVVDAEAGKEFVMSVPVKKVFNNNIANDVLSAEVTVTQRGNIFTYSQLLRSIQYDHIPHINYFYHDNIRVVNDEIKTGSKKVGYIMGVGDKVPADLVQMGYDIKLLGAADITDENLKQFDAIVTGVRAYDVDQFLNDKYDILMRYVNNGGNLVVQYNRSNLISSGKIKVGPYPFAITGTRVTDESADVHVLLPNSPALNYPNKIMPTDFEGWVQERSIYQADHPDAHYEAPIGMHDPNEAESTGSLIIAKYGKGNFVYTGIVFFRELPAGVSGAYKLMANLIALPLNK